MTIVASVQSVTQRRYIPELDAFRALAVFTVLFSHGISGDSGAAWLKIAGQFGNTGVQLFFVLSGFLITGILLGAKGKDNYFTAFYARRGLRIWPIYYLLLTIAFLSYQFIPALTSTAKSSGWSGASWPYLLYLQNIVYGHQRQPIPLGPTWTLAVEEQFYLVWPLLVRFSGRKSLTRVALALVIMTPLVRAMQLFDTWNTVCQFDSLALGALLAIHSKRLSTFQSLARKAVWLLPIGMIIQVSPHMGLVGDLALPKMLQIYGGASLLVLTLHRSGKIAGLFNNKPLQFVGRISYGVYLYNVVAFGIVDVGARHLRIVQTANISVEVLFLLLKILAVLFVATISFYLIERPFLKLKKHFEVQTAKPRLVLEKEMS